MQVNLSKYPPETVKILHQDIFCFCLCDEDFVSRTITEGSVDLDKLAKPASKNFESSKTTVCHIKQVAGDLQATQIKLMRHQRTELPTYKHNKKRRLTGKPKPYKTPENQATNQVRKPYDSRKTHKIPDCCNKCGDSIHTQGFQCPAKKYQCKSATNMVTSQAYVIKRRLRHITRAVTETLKCINFMQVQCMCTTVPITVFQKIPALVNHFACSYKPKTTMLKVSRFQNVSI